MTQHTTPEQRLRHLEDRADGLGLWVAHSDHHTISVFRTRGDGFYYRWTKDWDSNIFGPFGTYRTALEDALDWDGRMPDEEES